MSKNKISWTRRKLIDLIACLYPNTPKLKYNIPKEQLSEIIPIIMDGKWKKFPEKWRQDPLSNFIGQFYINNIIATFDNQDLAVQYEYLQKIQECFISMGKKIKDPHNHTAMHLFFRAGSAYATSCITSMAGQSSESHTLLRSCLEYGAYGFYIFTDTSRLREKIWLSRSNSPKEKNTFRKEFTQRNLSDSIKEKDVGLAVNYESLYEYTIDYGAHPNKAAIKQGYFEKENEVGLEVGQLYLDANPENLKTSLNKTLETGVTVLQMIKIICPKIFEDYDISEKLSEVEKALEKNIS